MQTPFNDIETLRKKWLNSTAMADVGIEDPNIANAKKLTNSSSDVYAINECDVPHFFIPRMKYKPIPWLLEKVITNLGIHAGLSIAPVVLRPYNISTPELELGVLSLRQHECTSSAFQVFIDRALIQSEDTPPKAHRFVSEWHTEYPDEDIFSLISDRAIYNFETESEGTPFSDWLTTLYTMHGSTISSVVPFALMAGVTDLNPGNVIFDKKNPESAAPYFVDFESHLDFQGGSSISLSEPWKVTQKDLQALYNSLTLAHDGRRTPTFIRHKDRAESITKILETLTDGVIDKEIDKIQTFAGDNMEEDDYGSKAETIEHLRQYAIMIKARREQLRPFFN